MLHSEHLTEASLSLLTQGTTMREPFMISSAMVTQVLLLINPSLLPAKRSTVLPLRSSSQIRASGAGAFLKRG